LRADGRRIWFPILLWFSPTYLASKTLNAVEYIGQAVGTEIEWAGVVGIDAVFVGEAHAVARMLVGFADVDVDFRILIDRTNAARETRASLIMP